MGIIPKWILKRISKTQDELVTMIEKMDSQNTKASQNFSGKTLVHDKYILTIDNDDVIVNYDDKKVSIAVYFRKYIKEYLERLYEEIKEKK